MQLGHIKIHLVKVVRNAQFIPGTIQGMQDRYHI